jgi:hypothetical protein
MNVTLVLPDGMWNTMQRHLVPHLESWFAQFLHVILTDDQEWGDLQFKDRWRFP